MGKYCNFVQGKNANSTVDPGVSDLSSQSSDAGLTRQQIAERRVVSQQYDVVEGSKRNPHTLMFEYSIVDCLSAKEGDTEDISNLKSQVQCCLQWLLCLVSVMDGRSSVATCLSLCAFLPCSWRAFLPWSTTVCQHWKKQCVPSKRC